MQTSTSSTTGLNLVEILTDLSLQSSQRENFMRYILEYAPIQPFLGNSFILQWDKMRKDFQYIYIGSILQKLTGEDVTGSYFLDTTITQERLESLKAHREVIETRTAGYIGGEIKGIPGYTRWDQLMLPIVEQDKCEKVFAYIGYS